jgi:hypothetical protein
VSNNIFKLEPTTFAEAGIRERSDLQRWIVKNPSTLGEELFIITTEFTRFDNSNRRVDILALDKNSRLVVIELKLDTKSSHADLQALRYAALCSNLTIVNIIDAFSEFQHISQEIAQYEILEFLKTKELPALTNKPRIIIASGKIDDELFSCTQWLQNFELEIKCVELTAYKSEGGIGINSKLRVEHMAHDNIIKDVKKPKSPRQLLDKSREREFGNKIKELFSTRSFPEGLSFCCTFASGYIAIRYHERWNAIWYQWCLSKKAVFVSLAVGIDAKTDTETYCDLIVKKIPYIEEGLKRPLKIKDVNTRKQFEFEVPFTHGNYLSPGIAPEAADLMHNLIDRTWPIVSKYFKENE